MKDKGNSGGISLLGVLGVVFVVLKLCRIINWSWVWVLAPLWGGIALEATVLIVCVIVWYKKIQAMTRLTKREAMKTEYGKSEERKPIAD